jgi:hypothetical protein
LQEVEREHGDLGVLAVVAGEDPLAAVVDLVVGGVPVLDDLQAGVDLAAELRVGEVVISYVESRRREDDAPGGPAN